MESMERCTGHCHITEIMLKIAIKSIDSCFSIFVVQIQSSCRRQNKCGSKFEFCFRKGTNILGKRRKCSIFSFSQNIFKGPLLQGSLNVGIELKKQLKFLTVKGRKLIYLPLHFLIIFKMEKNHS